MNTSLINELKSQCIVREQRGTTAFNSYMVDRFDTEKFAELIVKEYASEYNKLINGESVVLPKDREHATALVRVGMFYLENNK
jgi:hypothetical protein